MTQVDRSQPFSAQRKQFGTHEKLRDKFVDDEFTFKKKAQLNFSQRKTDSSVEIRAELKDKENSPFLSDQFRFWFRPCPEAFIRVRASLDNISASVQSTKKLKDGNLLNCGVSYCDHWGKGLWWLRPSLNYVLYKNGGFSELNVRLNTNREENTLYARLFHRQNTFFAGFFGVLSVNRLSLLKRQTILGFQDSKVHVSIRNQNLWDKDHFKSLAQFMGKITLAGSYQNNDTTIGLQLSAVPHVEHSHEAVFAVKKNMDKFWAKLRLSSKKRLALGIGHTLQSGSLVRASMSYDLEGKKIGWGVAFDAKLS